MTRTLLGATTEKLLEMITVPVVAVPGGRQATGDEAPVLVGVDEHRGTGP